MTRIFWLLLLLGIAQPAFPTPDRLLIISPHRKSMQQEFIPRFKNYYKEKFKEEINVEWLDQGGATDDWRYLLSRFETNPKSSGIDIFWGGGEQPHYDLDSRGLLISHKLSPELRKQVPAELNGIPLTNSAETWHASAINSFGIFFNKRASDLLKLPTPDTWDDLADPAFYHNVSMADPRRSSSNVTMIMIILNAYGWEKGWEVLTGMAANTKRFTHSSSDPIKSVLTGDTTTGLSVGYYASPKILEIGPHNLGFKAPTGKTILNPDPISILKGAPNLKAAQRFLDYILSHEVQKLLVLPAGESQGPTHSTLGRMAVNSKTYAELPKKYAEVDNPFQLEAPIFRFDMLQATLLQGVVVDLYSAMLVDQHEHLQEAWKLLIDKKLIQKVLPELSRPAISEKKLEELAKKWEKASLRNKCINDWSNQAKLKYQKILSAYK